MQESQIFFTAYPSTPGDCHEQFTVSEQLERLDLISFYLTGVQACQVGGMTDNHQTSPAPSPQVVSNIANSDNLVNFDDSCLPFANDCGQRMSPESSLLFEDGVLTAKHGCSFAPADDSKASDSLGETLFPPLSSNSGLWPASFDNNHGHLNFSQELATDSVCFGALAAENCYIVPNSLYGSYLHQDDQIQDIFGLNDMLICQQQDQEARENRSPSLDLSDVECKICKKEQTGSMSHTPNIVKGLESQQQHSIPTPGFDTDAEAKALVGRTTSHTNTSSSDTTLLHGQYDSTTKIGDYGIHQVSQPGLDYPPLPLFVPDLDMGSINFDSCSGFNDFSGVQQHLLPEPLLDVNYYSEHPPALRGGYVPGYEHPQIASNESQCSQDRRESVLRDTSKDEFLLDCRRQGLSYREIKAKGGFEEAESTLRGRVRALTKPKEARVRKPDWTESEVIILKQTVEQFLRASIGGSLAGSAASHRHGARAQRHALNRIPWKQVAESMASRGCYHFGNATVKKKYMEVMGYQDGTCD